MPGRVDVEVRHGAQPLRVRAARPARRARTARRTSAYASGTPNTTMFVSTRAEVDVDAGQLGEALGQAARVGVVLGQALDVVVERVQRPRPPRCPAWRIAPPIICL